MHTVKLGDIVEIKKGKKPEVVLDAPCDGSLPCLLIDEVRGKAPTNFTTDTKGVEVSKSDICIIWDGANAGTIGFGVEGLIGSTVARLRIIPQSRWDTGFVGRLLQGQFQSINAAAHGKGATIPHVDKRHLEAIEFPAYSLEEQRRIAAILDQADDIRRKRQHAIDRLNQLGQAIFYEMFGGVTSLDTASLKTLGKVSTGSTPPTSDANSFGGPVPFVTPGDLGVSGIVKRSLSETGALKSRMVSAGSTLVCCIGATIGKMDQAHQRSAFNQQINAIEWGGRIDPMFGFFAVQQIRDTIVRKGKGASTTLPILKKSEFEKLDIIVPKIEDQKLFSAKINEITFLSQELSSHYSNSENLFASLQHRAFAGEL